MLWYLCKNIEVYLYPSANRECNQIVLVRSSPHIPNKHTQQQKDMLFYYLAYSDMQILMWTAVNSIDCDWIADCIPLEIVDFRLSSQSNIIVCPSTTIHKYSITAFPLYWLT